MSNSEQWNEQWPMKKVNFKYFLPNIRIDWSRSCTNNKNDDDDQNRSASDYCKVYVLCLFPQLNAHGLLFHQKMSF